jgi:hypothetical protein
MRGPGRGPAPIRTEAARCERKNARPREKFPGPPVVDLLTLAAGASAAILAAGLAAVVAATRAAACGLELASLYQVSLAECHCTENENERKKCDGTLHLNLLLTLEMLFTNLASGFIQPRSGIDCLNVRRSLNPKNLEEDVAGRTRIYFSIHRQTGNNPARAKLWSS